MKFLIALVVLYVIGAFGLAVHAYNYFNSITFGVLTFCGCLIFTPVMGVIVLADTF